MDPVQRTHPKATSSAAAPVAPVVGPVVLPALPAVAKDDTAQHLSQFIHRHPKLTQNLPGYTVYQFIRGGVAAIPYGISMALTLGGLTGLERFGKGMAERAAAGSAQAAFGTRLKQFASFPAIKTSAMVATSFTLYRGTSKIVKWMNDSLFDPKDSEAQTAEKIRHLPQATVAKIKENAPAGVASTPVAALALGFITATFNKNAKPLRDELGHSLDWAHQEFQLAKAQGHGWKRLKNVVLHPNAQFLEHALINTVGYSIFFEIGDRLFKDRQIARGVWKGDDSSITGAKTAPNAVPQKKHYGFFTDEPSVGRFAFRRMAPTLVSIGAYTAFKFRHAYMHLGDFAIKPTEEILPKIPKLIRIETLAVLWFAMIPFLAEKWEKAYDGFFASLEKKAARKDALAAIPVADAKPDAEHSVKPMADTGTPGARIAQVTAHGKAALTQEQQVAAL